MRAIRYVVVALILAVAASAYADGDRAAALAHFNAGIELIDKKQWQAALNEFTQSRKLYLTRTAIKNAAICLRELGRYDEALATYRELLSMFADVSEAERASIEVDSQQLARFIGTLQVETTPAGATVIVDGRERGTTPLSRPLDVAVGTRALRIVKPGFEPFETRVIIASNETTRMTAELTVVAEVGRLRVRETSGRKADVSIDGVTVGTTPWDGSTSVGEHVVKLRGVGDVGASATVRVDFDTVADVDVAMTTLMGDLIVEPSPIDARVKVAGKRVSIGTFSDRVPSGTYAVSVDADWHVSKTVTANVSSGEPQRLRVVLDRVPRTYAEIYGGLSLLPTYSAPAATDCNGNCIGDFIAIRAGYRVTRHVGVEIFFAPKWDVARVSGAQVSASLFISSGGGAIRYEVFERTPLTFRFTAGFGRGSDPNADGFWTPVFGPDVNIGYRLGSTGIVMSAGVAAMLFVVSQSASQKNASNAVATSGLDGGLGLAVIPMLTLHGDI